MNEPDHPRYPSARPDTPFQPTLASGEHALSTLALRQLKGAWTDWMATLPWHHYLDLTFDQFVSTDTAEKRFLSFRRHLGRLTDGCIDFFGAVARGPAGDRIHVHVVLWGTNQLTTREIHNAWRPGYDRVAVYDDTKGGVGYIVTNLWSPDAHLLIPRNPVRRAR